MPASPALRRDPDAAVPESSSIVPIAFANIESDAVRIAYQAWEKWRGPRALPLRDDIAMRDLSHHAANISLVRALPGESDYEFRIIGDVHVQAYGVNHQGKRMSEVIGASPRFGRLLKASYDMVRAMGRAYAFRGALGRDALDSRFVWFETCYLPFGPSADAVDYVMNAACYVPRGGTWA